MRLTKVWITCLCCVALSVTAFAQDPPETDPDEMSLDEISRKLENPLTTLWSLTFQNNTAIQNGDLIDGDTVSNTLFFQPFLPIPVGANDEYVFVARRGGSPRRA